MRYSNRVVKDGDTLVLNWDDTSSGTRINDYGEEIVGSGAQAFNSTINSGGEQYVLEGGRASGTNIKAGGAEILRGGTSQDLSINGGLETVENGGVSIRATINNGGVENVQSGGKAEHTTINAGGSENVQGGGASFDTIVNKGGIETIQSGAVSHGDMINGGVENVLTGAMSDHTTINSGGVENVLSGGRSDHTTINAGGVENVQAGVSDKLASATTINAGGVLNVLSGGAAELSNINGGVQNVQGGGKSFDTTINNGGVENVEKGALSDRGIVNSGGVQNVFGVSNATINDGGVENVEKGGLSDKATINRGGVEILDGTGVENGVATGGHALNTRIDNGTLIVQAGAVAQNIYFDGSDSTLELASPLSLRGTIFNWHVGENIDFLNTSVTSVQEISGDAPHTSQLKITYSGGTVTYKLWNVADDAAFKLQSDGHGGTELILTPVVGVHNLHHDAGHIIGA